MKNKKMIVVNVHTDSRWFKLLTKIANAPDIASELFFPDVDTAKNAVHSFILIADSMVTDLQIRRKKNVVYIIKSDFAQQYKIIDVPKEDE